jgi:hypothetical protein
MSWLKVLVGFLIIGGVLVGWYRFMQSVRGGGDGRGLNMDVGRKRKKGAEDGGDNELERIIAMHRAGVPVEGVKPDGPPKLTVVASNPPPAPNAVVVAPGQTLVDPASAAQALARPAAAALLQAPALLSGAGKLAFLAFKAALPNHHVFARIPLCQLVPQEAPGSDLARHAHAVVVCRSDFTVRAVVDVSDPSIAARLTEVHRALEAHAIHHLVVDPRKMPKPKEIRALLHA